VFALCAAAMVIAATGEASQAHLYSQARGTPLPLSVLPAVRDVAVPTQVRRRQVAAWVRVGGGNLINRFVDDLKRIAQAWDETKNPARILGEVGADGV
jgi:hypothetical protein